MRLVLPLFITLGILVGSIANAIVAPVISPTYAADDLLLVKPELRQEVAARLPAGMTQYQIDLEIGTADPITGIRGEGFALVTVTNTTGETLNELPFRLYANSARTLEDAVTITSARISDSDVAWSLSVNNSIATIPLREPLAAGEKVVIEIGFSLSVFPNDASRFGMLNYNSRTDTAVIAHWYPVLAGRDPDTGWMLEPTSAYGDPIFTDAGLYDVRITAPEHQTLITSGVITDEAIDGDRQVVTYNAKPSRDFVIIMSGTLESSQSDVDGTMITSWFLPNDRPVGELTLQWTGNTLGVFNPLLGEYPWVQLQAVEAEISGGAAVELPQMILMGASFYTRAPAGGALSYYEFTVAHEVVHQWFYSLVGNNQYDHAFIDEGLTNYLSGYVYFREMYGHQVGQQAFLGFLYQPFREMIEANADVVVDFPTDDFPSQNSYSSAVYTKAPIGFFAIHQQLGDEAFFAALSNYVHDFSFRVATPADLEAAFQAQTDIDMRAIWSHWFERREGALDIRGN